MSSLSESRPDPAAAVSDTDMNTWTQVKPPRLENSPQAGWVQFRSERFKPFSQQAKEGGLIRFKGIEGKAELWLDGTKVADKTDAAPMSLEIPLPPGDREHQLVLLFHKEAGVKEVGLGGVVTVEAKN